MNVLGIDFGTKKLGLAVIETESGVASPLPMIRHDIAVFDQIITHIKNYRVKTVVFGDPSYENTQKKVHSFATELAKKVPIEVHFESEDNTSIGIKSTLISKKQKEQLDSLSAVAILEQWLTHNFA